MVLAFMHNRRILIEKKKKPAVLGVGEAGSDGLHRSVSFVEEKLFSCPGRCSSEPPRLPFPQPKYPTPTSGLGVTHASKAPAGDFTLGVQHGVGRRKHRRRLRHKIFTGVAITVHHQLEF
jgi:hypothetical protein